MKYLITTTHSPSQRTRTFVKDLASVLPNSEKVSRGKLSLDLLGAIAADMGADKVLIVGERYGNPSFIEVYDVENAELVKRGTIRLKGVSLSSETKRRVYNVKSLCLEKEVLDEKAQEVLQRLSEILSIPFCEGESDLKASLERGERGFELVFRAPGSKAIVGPVIRIREIDIEGEG
ncbi:Brix domain protein [Ignicoccus pacificus DSM 13166]|uniref:Probable Brix domain-containing ribosomal biogenesis protein n=1 Tax=Ignicoccus pacificus DSM 13166 TaxID=940294 RepID=A0A977KA35_9CREN|nr:Brix domain protein [Ignicoccus pacificus DSM 13166]